jgi:hypothetical protein
MTIGVSSLEARHFRLEDWNTMEGLQFDGGYRAEMEDGRKIAVWWRPLKPEKRRRAALQGSG